MNQRARKLRKSQTDAENRLWGFLRNRRLAGFKFRRQYPIPPYIADFVCMEAGLIIEIDGGQHASEQLRDEERSQFLKSVGYRTVRFWNNDVLLRINEVLRPFCRSWAAPHPHPSPEGRGKPRACAGRRREGRRVLRRCATRFSPPHRAAVRTATTGRAARVPRCSANVPAKAYRCRP